MGIRIIRAADLNDYLKKPDVCVIDIRDKADYAQYHIEGSVHVQEKELEAYVKRKGKHFFYVLCCHKGIASVHQCKRLYNMGYRVGTVAGGMAAYMKSH